ncbi:hypothetical protein Hanom_Chr00s000142g01625801 [Helianthus anomalus]
MVLVKGLGGGRNGGSEAFKSPPKWRPAWWPNGVGVVVVVVVIVGGFTENEGLTQKEKGSVCV